MVYDVRANNNTNKVTVMIEWSRRGRVEQSRIRRVIKRTRESMEREGGNGKERILQIFTQTKTKTKT